MDPTALANLLAVLIPLGAKTYMEIRANHANQANMPTVEELLNQADANWDAVIEAAKAELAKVGKPTT